MMVLKRSASQRKTGNTVLFQQRKRLYLLLEMVAGGMMRAGNNFFFGSSLYFGQGDFGNIWSVRQQTVIASSDSIYRLDLAANSRASFSF